MLYHYDLIFYSIIAGFILDCLVGDPEKLPHPVRGIGVMISFWEKRLRMPTDTPEKQRRKGALLVVLVILGTMLITGAVLVIAYQISSIVFVILQSILCAQVLAARNLRDASMRVYRALQRGDLEEARYAVSMIVGRDTSVLDQKGITKAAIETVAENTSDGVIAPLFFLAIGGPLLGMAYKAVNTMDSMIGYKNEKYQYFGTVAAVLDDIVNFIPARISGIMMVIAAGICKMNVKNAWYIFKRDRFQHASPNAAQTESVCAGALEVQLAGDAWYFGKLVQKPYLGDPIREIEQEDIVKANRLMYGTTVLCVLFFLLIRFWCRRILG